MSKYARFQADPERQPPLEVTIRRATPDDAQAIAELDAQRNQFEPKEIVGLIRKSLAASPPVWVALADGAAVGFGRLRWLDPTGVEGARGVPAGHFLMGMVVAPQHRRRGVGRQLTQTRLEWIVQQGAREAFYVANLRNRPSIDLHASLGFEELTRDFEFPGVTSARGTYALYRVEL